MYIYAWCVYVCFVLCISGLGCFLLVVAGFWGVNWHMYMYICEYVVFVVLYLVGLHVDMLYY